MLTKVFSQREILRLADAVRHTKVFDPNTEQYVAGFASMPIGKWQYQETEPIVRLDGWCNSVDHPAWLTVNRYNAVVLNSSNLLIADIDIGDERLDKHARINDVDEVIETISNDLGILDRNDPCMPCSFAEQSYRIYRTHSGCRVICTSMCFPFWEIGYDALRFMRFVKSDPHYMKLCYSQQCYRARLSPKPWRVDGGPTHVCSLVETIGSVVHPDLESQLELHDEMTLSDDEHSSIA